MLLHASSQTFDEPASPKCVARAGETGCSPVLEIRDYKTLVRAAWRARDFNAVAVAADKLLDKAPGTPDIARMRVKALLSLARLQEAAAAVLPLAGAEPQLAATVVGALVKAREIEPAARILIALRAAGARAGDAHSALQGKVASLLLASGNAEERAGAPEKARAAFLLGAQAAPENGELQRKVSNLRNAARNAAKGVDFETDAAAYVAAWNSLLALEPGNVNAMKRLAVAAEKSGDHVAAME